VKGLFFLLNVNINDANVSFPIGLFWTILNNATAQYFPVATHAADTKQFKVNITCSNESQYTCFIVGYGRR
jgi:hypothetical protein